MKVKVEFITARLNDKLLFVEAINDCYDEVQVVVNKNDLDEELIRTLRELSSTFNIIECEDAFILGYCEAKDCCGTYGELKVWIESKEIDFE